MKKPVIFLTFISVIFSRIAIASQDVKKIEEDTLPVRELFENPFLYDGKDVTVKGEVIGDIMRDGESFWINIGEEGSFIGIVIDTFQKEKIRYIGRYRIKGDIVKISGTYHLHCPIHLGERDIHAKQLEIIESGYKIQEEIQSNRVIGCILLVIITIFVLLYSHREHVRRDTVGQQK